MRHGFEPLLTCRERTETGFGTVRDNEQLIHREQRGQFGFVSLEFARHAVQISACSSVGVLEFKHAERQAIHEQHHVKAAVAVTIGDSHLVDREEVVSSRPVVVHDDNSLNSANHAVGHSVLDSPHPGQACGGKAWLRASRGRSFGASELAEGIVKCLDWQFGIEPHKRFAQSLL